MSTQSHQNLKTITFEGQMLPKWASLLDLAAGLSRVPEATRGWFSRFTNSPGVDDARTIMDHCAVLQSSVQKHRESMLNELRRARDDSQPSVIIAAWEYALETMAHEARSKKTCSWLVEGIDGSEPEDSAGGTITLNRV